MQVLPTLGERGRTAVMRDFVAANRGYNYIDRYLPPEDQSNQPTSEDTLASLENNQLEKGEMVVVSPDNVHSVHAQRHLNRMQQIAKAFNEAEDAARANGSLTPQIDAGNFGQYSLEEVDVAFQTTGPHFVRHLLYLQQDPTRKELAQSLGAQWAILANFGDKIANNAQNHRTKQLADNKKRQEEIEEMESDQQIKMAAVVGDLQLKQAKLIGDMRRAANRDQLEFLVKRQKVSLEAEIKRMEARKDVARTATEQTTGKGQNEAY